jgi:hypothetical protein
MAKPHYERTDYSVVVKNRAPPPKAWRWEIYRAGNADPIKQSSTPVTVDFCPGLSTPVRDTRGQGQPRPFSSISLPQVTSEHSSHDE